jgi:dGTPase
VSPTIREQIEAREREWLAPEAATASASRGRAAPEPEDDLRTAFQRDRDRILHSKAFRRLKHKTQVFLAPEGDHYRTRLTHTLEVAQIARTIARALRLNEDLTEAIALGHDLGHPPFGHAGEAALDEAMAPYGGFRHVEQSLRVVDLLERRRRADGTLLWGLNLTWEVRDGIGGHSKGLRDLEAAADAETQPATREGQIVRLADRIAYVHHDMDDAVRAGILDEAAVPAAVRTVLGPHRGEWLSRMVHDVVRRGREAGRIELSDEIREAQNRLKDFLSDQVYLGSHTADDIRRAQAAVRALFAHYLTHPEEIPEEFRSVPDAPPPFRMVCDFLAGMTDRYARRAFEAYFPDRNWAAL